MISITNCYIWFTLLLLYLIVYYFLDWTRTQQEIAQKKIQIRYKNIFFGIRIVDRWNLQSEECVSSSGTGNGNGGSSSSSSSSSRMYWLTWRKLDRVASRTR